MRRAAKIDSNQPDIVEALRKIGATVYPVGRPLDLLVGYRGRTFIIEVKEKHGTLTPNQRDFLATWKGQMNVVRTPDEAIKVVTESYS